MDFITVARQSLALSRAAVSLMRESVPLPLAHVFPTALPAVYALPRNAKFKARGVSGPHSLRK